MLARRVFVRALGLTLASTCGGWLRAGLIPALCIFAAPLAVSAAAPADPQVYELSLPPQDLQAALVSFAERTGIQLLYSAQLTKGLTSSALRGSFTPQDGLRILLVGTGLTFKFSGVRTVTLSRDESASGARVLGPVRVQGASAEELAVGVNGSRDVTATEGSGSYTSDALTVGSKDPQSLKSTTQSVSVLTQQRMQDQNITDVRSALNQTTGVTLRTNSSVYTAYFARGFQITNFQVDGGAALIQSTGIGGETSTYYPLMDLAMYDHVEVLRGADGMFNGYGEPSGSVNLVRKRPLDHPQLTVESEAGSWSNYRVTVDGTQPLGFDGAVRGRAVVSYVDRDYFYDTASMQKTTLYGIVEADLTSNTLLSVGGSFARQNSVPWIYALPRNDNGDDLRLPRSTCTCFAWNSWDFDSTEIFAQLEQHIGENWTAKLNVTNLVQTNDRKGDYVYGAVVAGVQDGQTLTGYLWTATTREKLADLTINGKFTAFGLPQKVVFGASYQRADSGDIDVVNNFYDYPGQTLDIRNFNQADYLEPATPPSDYSYVKNDQKQWNAYTQADLMPIPRLHVLTGVHFTRYAYDSATRQLDQITPSHSGDHDFSWPPRYSLLYDVTPSLAAYVSYANIYTAQLNYIDEAGQGIDPLTGSNLEAGLKFESASRKLNASVVAYRVLLENFPLWTGYGPYENTYGVVREGTICCYVTDPARKQLSQGLEAEVSGEVLPGWQLSFGYTYNDNELKGAGYAETRGERFNSYTPAHLLKLFSTYQFRGDGPLHGLSVGGGVNAQTSHFVSGTACVAYTQGTNPVTGALQPECAQFADFDYVQRPYAVIGMRAAYRLTPRWMVSLNVNNVLDKVYYETMGSSTGGNWYGEPRSFTLNLRGNF